MILLPHPHPNPLLEGEGMMAELPTFWWNY